MPGLSIIVSRDRLTRAGLSERRESLEYKDGYHASELISTRDVTIIFSGYDGYPVWTCDDRDIFLLVEGLVYNRDDAEIESRLRSLTDLLIGGRDQSAALSEFVEKSDGDFLVLIYLKKTRDIIIFNDRWGRLPTFYSVDKESFVLSRELRFILDSVPLIQFDLISMAEFLSLEYNLGSRTLFKNIRRMKPASVIRVALTGKYPEFQEDILLPIDCRIGKPQLSRDECLKECVSLFRQSLKKRVQKVREKELNITVDLSGGYDSRTVFAGLCNLDTDMLVCHDNIITGDESGLAERVATTFGRNLLCFSAQHPVDDIAELRRVTYMTDGLVNCWISTSCFYDDLEREKTIKGPKADFMGLGVETLRQMHRPKSLYDSLVRMLADDVYTHYISISQACALLKLDKHDFIRHLERETGEFQESDTLGRVRRLYFEYHNKIVNDGENRHRMFYWTVAPFWSNDLFSFVTKHIPPKLIGHNFFLQFMKMIDPRALETPFYGSSLKPDSPISRSLFGFKRVFHNLVRDNRYAFKLVRGIIARREKTEQVRRKYGWLAEEILQTVIRSELVNSYFHVAVLSNYLRKSASKLGMYQLLTLTHYMAEIERRYESKIVPRS